MAEVTTQVDGRTLRLSNLDKALYPSGFTKGEVIAYYHAVAPVILPHLAGRPTTRVRFPNGTESPSFFEKNVPAGTPDWVSVVIVTGFHERNVYPLINELATLVWLANLAALELHTHQWRVPAGATEVALSETMAVDRLVIDLDPGPGVTMPLTASAAILVAGALAEDGLSAAPKTSGSKGLQLYVPLSPTPADAILAYARALGARLTAEHPDLFVTRIAKEARKGRILLDLNQNLPGRTTVCPYSLRGRNDPTVSTPVTWDEVGEALDGHPLRYTTRDVIGRIERHGDLFDQVVKGTQHVIPTFAPGEVHHE